MATAPRKTTKPAAIETEIVEPKSNWLTMLADATADYVPKPDYVFDGCTPPALIHEPVTAEQVLAMASLADQAGDVRTADMLPMFRSICGDEFSRVWAVVGKAHVDGLMALAEDIIAHFSSVPAEIGDTPGGDSAS